MKLWPLLVGWLRVPVELLVRVCTTSVELALNSTADPPPLPTTLNSAVDHFPARLTTLA